MRWLSGISRFLTRAAVALVLVLLVLGILVTKTTRGKEWVLRQVLARVEGLVNGELVVEGVSSPGLLSGFTFTGVRISDPEGRPFLVADSVRAGLSTSDLIRGDLILTRVRVWNPRVTLERISRGEPMNAARIFAPDRLPDTLSTGEGLGLSALEDSAGAAWGSREGRRTIALRDVRLFGGSLDLYLPVPDPPRPASRFLIVPGSGGIPDLRKYTFREIDLRLEEALVRSPDMEGQLFEVQALSLLGQVWPDPFHVQELAGRIRIDGPGLTASLQTLRLPSSEVRGAVTVAWGGARGVRVGVEGEAESLALQDLHFIEERLPRGNARGPFGLVLDESEVVLDFRGTDLSTSLGEVQATGRLVLGRGLGFRDLDLTLASLDLEITDPWLLEPLPLRGVLDGTLWLSGDPSSLQVDSDLTFLDPASGGTTGALVSGTFRFADTLGVSGLNATLAPMDWSTFASLSPAMRLRGPGALRLEAEGDASSGFHISAEATYVPAGYSPSRVTAEGFVGTGGEETVLDLTGDLRPLSLTALAEDFPEIRVTGEVSGVISLEGPLSDLTVETELETVAGPLAIQARFDARNPAQSYNIDTRAEDFLLSDLLPSLPEPTRVTGRALASGRGMQLDSIQGEATVFVRRGEVGALEVDTAAMVLRVEDGLLHLEALVAETGLGHLEAGGTFGLASTAPPGELNVRVESESLTALRPFIMGEVPRVLEDLSIIERNYLVDVGENLDTIPRAEDYALEGRLQGSATFVGGLRDFTGEGSLAFQELRYKADYVEAGTLTFSAQGLPGDASRMEGLLRTDSIHFRALGFQGAQAQVELGRSDGRVRLVTQRPGDEEYRIRGTFALDTLGGGVVNLDEMTLRLDSVQWNLGGPSSLLWGPEGVRIRDFQLIRPGEGNMRIRADGFLPLRGEGDIQLEVERLDLARLARVVQLDEVLEGLLDFQVNLTGPSEDPELVGSFSGRDLRYGEFSLDGLDSEFQYRDLGLRGDVMAWEGDRQAFSVRGLFPADLRVEPDGPRIPEAPVDLTLAVDSFSAALALSFLQALDDVEGTISGDVHFGGTPRGLEPRGELQLTGGAASLQALGVRHREMEARFGLTPDGGVHVDGTLRSQGTARVSGTVTLDPVTDPLLDLTVETRGFLAVNRRDVQASMTGSLELRESYRQPFVTGALTVEEGVLTVEELARSAEVVDLADPAFFDVVDTTRVSLRPILQASQNPFLQNLRLDVDLSMARGTWLRGKDMNVEMAGELDVFWDRNKRDLALVGELEAVRGYYRVLGRQFEVEEGGVSFLGTPGINPTLDIQALNRLRTFDNVRLEIIALVRGTLLNPRVTLSSNAPFPIAESDLVSYLIFGRPSYALASGQSTFAEGAASSLLGAATGAGATLAMGSFSNALGSVFTRGGGLDYLAITQGQGAASLGTRDLQGTVATTQVEIGQYVTPDIFAALLWRPLTGMGSSAQSPFAGLRMEWRVSDFWTLEGFIEDRFARSPLFLAGDLGPRLDKVLGFFFFREWGY